MLREVVLSPAVPAAVDSPTLLSKTDEMRSPVCDGMLYASQGIDALENTDQRKPAMKKLSTAATKQSRNISQQTLTIGLDLISMSINDKLLGKVPRFYRKRQSVLPCPLSNASDKTLASSSQNPTHCL